MSTIQPTYPVVAHWSQEPTSDLAGSTAHGRSRGRRHIPWIVPIIGHVPPAPDGQWLADRMVRRVLLEIIRTPLAVLAMLYCVAWYTQAGIRTTGRAIGGTVNR